MVNRKSHLGRTPIHGESVHATRSHEYNVWRLMRQRCNDPKNKSFKHYGERGISVCDRWGDFSNFLQDMGRCPQGCSIDRIDPDGNYEPLNCRWASNIDQQRNKRSSIYLEHNGRTLHLKEWAQEIGVSYHALWQRRRSGKSVSEILKEAA